MAQTTGVLKGIIRDDATQLTLPNAIIFADHSSNNATNTDGNYSLKLDTGNHRIIALLVGFSADTFFVHIGMNDSVTRNISLKVAGQTLQTVVISGGKFRQRLEDLTMSMEVLKPGFINNKNTTSIETALEQVPGLTIIDNDPQIRGGSGFTFGVGSRVAIVMDGIPLLSGDAGRPEWNYIPVENIEQIEVIKGASSVLYGSSAINGVINIQSAGAGAVPKTMINVSAGGYSMPKSPAESWYNNSIPGFGNINFFHSRRIGKNVELVVGGNFNIDQGTIGPPPPLTNIPPDIKKAFLITDSIPTFSNADMLKLRGRMNVHLLYKSPKIHGLSYGLNANGMRNKTNMVLAWLNDSNGLYKGYPGAVFLETQTIFNIDPFIKYNPGNGFSQSLNMRIFHTNNVITNNQSNNGTIYYGEYQAQRSLPVYHLTITTGLMGSLAQSHAELYASSGTPDNQVANTAAYLQLDKKFLNIINFSGGGRLEYFNTNGADEKVAPIFRAGGSIQLAQGTFLRASYGEGYRYPTITERFIATKAGMFGVFPNPTLQPETSNSKELGLKQGFKFGDFMGYADAAAFSQRYHNTIEYLFGDWDPTVSLVGFKFFNTGDSRVDGLDFSLTALTAESNKKFGVTVMAGYTYINAVSLTPDLIYARGKNINGGIGDSVSFRNSSKDTANNALKYRYKNTIKADVEVRVFRFSVGVSYRLYSNMQNIDKAFQDLETLTALVPQIPDIKVINFWETHKTMHVFDLRVSYKVNERQKLSIICNNVFNIAYELRPLKIEPPRSLALQYVYHF